MTDHERAIWLTRLKNSIKGKYESELELQDSLSRAIQLLEFQHRVKDETSDKLVIESNINNPIGGEQYAEKSY